MSLRTLLLLTISLCAAFTMQAQTTCTTLGQNPGSAFPICGGTTFSQTTVPSCGGTALPVPAPCTGGGYTDINPFWYRFTCYVTGTFGFRITPMNAADDYDWQIYDITGRSPNDVYTDVNLVVGCNWSGLTGVTGASAAGTGLFNCGGAGWPLFSAMPTLLAGHEYIMLVSNFSPSQQGYQLNIAGGTANIIDPNLPGMSRSGTDCGGQQVGISLTKRVFCNSLAADGSDFVLTPAVATIVSASGIGCSSAFDLDSVQLTFSTPLPPGNYTVTVRNGTDGNTLIDNCTNAMPLGTSIPFTVLPRPPLPMGTVTVGACVGSSIQVTFPDNMLCSSVTPSGAEFVITGPSPVTVTGVGPVNCANANTFLIQLAAPITTPGNYQLQMVTGPDGNTLLGPCNREVPAGAAAPFTILAQPPLPMGTVTPPPCMPNNITVTFADNFLCSSIAADGSDFTITGPSGVTVTGAATTCATSGETNTVALQLSAPILVTGNYQVQVNTGSDGNTLANSCGRAVTAGSTANFTLAPQPPLPMGTVTSPGCSPSTITLNFPDIVYCGTLAGDGSDFTITGPSTVTITGASPVCNALGEVNSITLQLSGPITTSGTYTVTIGNGVDGNTLVGTCGRSIAVGENTPFTIPVSPSAIMNPLAALSCAPVTIRVNLSEPVQCTSIAANGSDFAITGPAAVTIAGAAGVNCTNGITSAVDIQLSSPIVTAGNYQLQLLTGNDGNTLLSECNRLSAPASISFTATDTVSASFTYQVVSNCTTSDISFAHPGGNGITSWSWTIDGVQRSTQQSFTQTLPGTGQYTIALTVSNGTCTATRTETITLANKVTIDFAMPDAICPEDSIVLENESTGPVDNWLWNFGNSQTSTLQDPPFQRYPATGTDVLYNITLTGFNTTNGCQQSKTKTLKVRATCLIAVPSGFTPNNDGKNDFFYPLNAFKAEKIDFKVFNRWGQEVFTSRDWTKKWDGKLGGIEQPTGVYVWIFRYTHADTKKEVLMRGTVTLIR